MQCALTVTTIVPLRYFPLRFPAQATSDGCCHPSSCGGWSSTATNGTLESAFKDDNKRASTRTPIQCFFCKKIGHTMAECWFRNKQQSAPPHQDPATPQRKPAEEREVKPIICFSCKEVGHKSPNCPKYRDRRGKKPDGVRRVQLPSKPIKQFKQNQIIADIDGINLPVTLDTGAAISIFPKELVPVKALTGRTIKATAVLRSQPMVIEEAMLKFNVNNHPIEVMGGVLPGAELNWVGIVGYDRNRTHLEQFMNEIFIEMMKRPVINPDYEDNLTEIIKKQGAQQKGTVQDSMKGLEINNGSSEEDDDVADLEILFGSGNGSYEMVEEDSQAKEGNAETGEQESTSKRDTHDGENIAYSNALQLQPM